ncbi:phosphoribosyltransferase [Nocardia amikacinitolerans]|uniref:phosphoribosyltransferase n=1 Tax=Nocardia amikacinitolerans TaxID=756689 RepID=UPI0020A36442|nr:phosphoribosyltransferase family protein [Nocardia amikacinitolerans]MCP2280378.1 putative phosphoribosyltransferase [Nocardia amikacinitolerans]
MPFRDRRAAGRRLAVRLTDFRDAEAVVLGVPRGGVPVAYEVARALNAPLTVAMVRKLRVPYRPELAFGAIGEGGVGVIDDKILARAFVSESGRAEVESEQRAELARSAIRYRGGSSALALHGRTAVIVDDGIASGVTARAAVAVVRAAGAERIALAAPVGAASAIRTLSGKVDQVVCLEGAEVVTAISRWYGDYAPVDDAQVCDLLDGAAAELRQRSGESGQQ